MKRKRKQFIAVILSGMMIFSTTGFAFADVDEEAPQTEPVKIEKEIEQPKTVEQSKEEKTVEEVVKEEPQKEETQQKQEVKKEESTKEESNTKENLKKGEEITKEEEVEGLEDDVEGESTKLCVHLKYRKANGEWTEAVTNLDRSGSRPINKILTSVPKNPKTDSTLYTYKALWKNKNISEPVADSYRIYAKDFANKSDVYFTALYDKEEIVKPYTVTYNVYYRSAGHGQIDGWVQLPSKEITVDPNSGDSSAWNGIQQGLNAMQGNGVDKPFSYGKTLYTFNGGWKDQNGKTYTAESSLNGDGYEEDTVVNIYAQYDEKELYGVQIKYIDKIGNGSHDWATGESTPLDRYSSLEDEGLREPADIGDYVFEYWHCEWNNTNYKKGDDFVVTQDDLKNDNTIIKLYATYSYQPSIQLVYNYKENGEDVTKTIGSNTESIDIYQNEPVNEKWFYEDNNTPIETGVVAKLPDEITGITEPIAESDKVVTIKVYAHYYTIIWINEDGTELEADKNVSYGSTPLYNGDTPTKKGNAQYSYTFKEWTPTIESVTGNAIYQATYTQTVNKYTITWKDSNGQQLEQDLEVPYGDMPSYDGKTPTKAATSKYTYKFAGWNPIIETVTGNAVYTATYDATPIPAVKPDPDNPDPKNPDSTKTKTKTEIIWVPGENVGGDGYTPPAQHSVLPTTKTPFTAPAEVGAWAFLNLLAVLANFVVCIFLLLMAYINKRKEDDEDEEVEVHNRMLGRICTLIIAIVSGIIFLLTEDMSLPMVWVDSWTFLMICTFVLQLIVGFLSKHKEERLDDEQNY